MPTSIGVTSASASTFPVTATLASGSSVSLNVPSTGLLVNSRSLGYSTDAFDRLRVSDPRTIFDYSSVLGKDVLRFDEVITGSGSSTANSASYISMTVSTNGDSVVRQSRRYITYQPGKSKLTLMTGVLSTAAVTGVISRIGQFSSVLGMFFQASGTTISVGIRNSSIDTLITQSNWNVDKFDGTGPSGFTIDFKKGIIFVFDLQWLGFGLVRYGLNIDGKTYVCHQISHAPFLGSSSTNIIQPYIQTAALPIRYEITSTVTGAAAEMRMTCGSVMSEGGDNEFGRVFSGGSFNTAVSVSTTTFVPLISFSLRADASGIPWSHVNVRPTIISILNTGGTTSMTGWKLVKNPTFTGTTPTFTNIDSTNSAVTMCIHAGTTTAYTAGTGYVIRSGYASAQNTEALLQDQTMANLTTLTTSISGVSDILTIVANSVGGTAGTLYAAMTWIEMM
jgi:hypothetical protein